MSNPFSRPTIRTSRRAFLKGSLGVGGLALLPRCVEKVYDRFELPLRIPPVLQPTRSDATTDYFTITQKRGMQRVLASGPDTPVEGYDGMWPGPTLDVRKGRRIVVTQINALDHRTTVHAHGLHVDPESDGHPTDYIEPGASKDYVYPNDQEAALLWYHDHTMDRTGPYVYGGLVGAYNIRDDHWDSLRLPSGEFEVPLIIQDRIFNPDGTFYYPALGPVYGDVFCVNGVASPHFEVAARKYLFRVVNGCDHRTIYLRLVLPTKEVVVVNLETDQTKAEPMIVVASEGGLLAGPVEVTGITIAPAERFGIVIDFSKYPVGTTLLLSNIDGANVPDDRVIDRVMRFDVVREAHDDSVIPDKLGTIVRYRAEDAAVTKQVFLTQTTRPPDVDHFTINGRDFDPGRVDLESKLDVYEIWDLDNPTPTNHTLHLHLVQFQILSVADAPPLPEHAGWKDTLLLRPNQRARIMLRPTTFTGVYVLHCHMIGHEDRGMMNQWQIVP